MVVFELCVVGVLLIGKEDVGFGYVYFVNIDFCIQCIRTHGSHMTFV